MDLKNVTIGYVPYVKNLLHPGDRRRFPHFAKLNDVPFEIADLNKKYDVVLITPHSDLSAWLKYRKKHPGTKFIFEMVDSMIFSSDLFRSLFKGVGRYITSKESKLNFDYKKPIVNWIRMADAVICSSTELENIIKPLNKNVFVSLDYYFEAKYRKSDYEIKGKMKLVWEGQSVVLKNLLAFKDVFAAINQFCELHIITDLHFTKIGSLIKVDTQKIINKFPITSHLHEWKYGENYKLLSTFDCGIIPINKKSPMAWHKPANKLISFWFTGMPTIVSNTPAYVEVMKNAGNDLSCDTKDEWIKRITEVKNMSAEKRRQLADQNFAFAQTHFSEEALSKEWQKLFDHVLK
ncbi:hypothetical protein BH09BAC2_BH09BAC2_02960 [soil metagenome]